MRKQEIVNHLKKDKQFISENFGVISIALFGYYPEKRDNETTNIDFLVEFKESSVKHLNQLNDFLENKFKSKIEIVRKDSNLSDHFLETIKGDLLYV